MKDREQRTPKASPAEPREPRPVGNPNIAEAGRATQFGAGVDPREARKKAGNQQSVRKAMKRVAQTKIPSGGDFSESALVEEFQRSHGSISIYERLAIKKISVALSGDVKALEHVTNDLDGKLVERRAEAAVTLAELVTGAFNDMDSDDDASSDSESE